MKSELKKITLTFNIAVTLLSLAGCHPSTESKHPAAVSSALVTLEVGSVRRIEFQYLPEETLVRTALSPESLATKATYRIAITDPPPSMMSEITEALRSEEFVSSTYDGDSRLAVLFYSESQEPVLALFFDQTGTQCMIGGISYKAKGKLRDVVRRRIRCLIH